MRVEDMEEILEKVVNSCYSVSKSLSSARPDRESGRPDNKKRQPSGVDDSKTGMGNCRKAQEKNIYGDSDKKI